MELDKDNTQQYTTLHLGVKSISWKQKLFSSSVLPISNLHLGKEAGGWWRNISQVMFVQKDSSNLENIYESKKNVCIKRHKII